MTANPWHENLATKSELKALALIRQKSVDEKIVKANNEQALDTKILGEEQDGWRVGKRLKLSARMIKDKPTDRQLEDDIWTLFYEMGFSELNCSRTLMIPTAGEGSPRQLDVFAKDSETVFVIECTHSRDGGAKSVKTLLDKIAAIREPVIQAIHSHYGKSPKLKIKFGIATRSFDWREVDRDRARASGIAIITDSDLAYFKKLTSIIRSSARYQFLARYLANEKVEGLRLDLLATRGNAGGRKFYSFLISPHDLLRISFISHRARTSNEDIGTYQRLVKPNRLAEIGKFIDEGGKFPTNIVVNFKVHDGLQFDQRDKVGDSEIGTLRLPGLYGCAWVIDGQHRLYGYAYSKSGREDKSVVNVLAYENLPIHDEVEMFVDINTRQVKVSRNLVNEILSTLDLEDPDVSKRLDALYARIALGLDGYSTSPLRNRLLTVSQDKSSQRCVTLTSLTDGISANALLGTIKVVQRTKTIDRGPLWSLDDKSQDTIERSVSTLSQYLAIFSTQLETHWELGDAKGGFLCTNLGIRALLRLFRRVLNFVEIRESMSSRNLNPADIIEMVQPYVQPVVDYFKNASEAEIQAFRSRGSSLASVDLNCLNMMAIIHEAKPEFATDELVAYVTSRDKEGTHQAKEMIDEISRILSADIRDRLSKHYAPANWWMQGVPLEIRNECDRRYNEEMGKYERWQYLFLINYSEIAIYKQNWEIFKDEYDFYGTGKKVSRVQWIRKLNDARKITHHAEKGPLSTTEVEFVRRVYSLVKDHIEAHKPVQPSEYFREEVSKAGSALEGDGN
jgi:DGQHR domain-containing protein